MTQSAKGYAYWTVADGQLSENEEVHIGFVTKEDAEEDAKGYPPEIKVEVRFLQTLEHALPSDHPDFHPNQIEIGYRWCPVIIEDQEKESPKNLGEAEKYSK